QLEQRFGLRRFRSRCTERRSGAVANFVTSHFPSLPLSAWPVPPEPSRHARSRRASRIMRRKFEWLFKRLAESNVNGMRPPVAPLTKAAKTPDKPPLSGFANPACWGGTNHRAIGSSSARALIEQNGPHLGVLHVHLARRLHVHVHATIDGRPRQHGVQPALEVRKFGDVLLLPFPTAGPADASDVGNGVGTGEKFAVGKTPVHDAVEAVAFVDVAANGIRDFCRRIAEEMVGLPGHRSEAADLPKQPLIDLYARPLIARIKLAGLAAEILQDGAGFEDGDRPAVRACMIDDCRHPIVRRD